MRALRRVIGRETLGRPLSVPEHENTRGWAPIDTVPVVPESLCDPLIGGLSLGPPGRSLGGSLVEYLGLRVSRLTWLLRPYSMFGTGRRLHRYSKFVALPSRVLMSRYPATVAWCCETTPLPMLYGITRVTGKLS